MNIYSQYSSFNRWNTTAVAWFPKFFRTQLVYKVGMNGVLRFSSNMMDSNCDFFLKICVISTLLWMQVQS